jgi:hypothetical protein
MSRRRLPIISLALLVATVGCVQEIKVVHFQDGSSGAQTNGWHPNTRLLDLAAQEDPKGVGSTLARDVKRFYQLLHDKQWQETYELRSKTFREIVPESYYLAEAKKSEGIWGLVSYDVLSIETQNSPGTTNLDTAVLICKFTELPDYAVSYSTVYWHNEGGTWKCLSAGPIKLDIFRGIISPFVDWR